MNPRPNLDALERLLAAHRGECPQPCDGCDLAAEVVSLHRLLQIIAVLGETPGGDPIPPEHEDALYWRALPDGREITVARLGTFVRLTIGVRGSGTYDDGFDYFVPKRAVEAARIWSGDGDPLDGWHRNINTGRRRENGDPTKETIRW